MAQAYLEVANSDYGGADITLQSAGGVRRPLQGPVTAADVIEVLPFGNLLFRLDITGAEVKSMIEDGLHATFREGGTTGPYPYTGGLRFDVNAAQARGQRASNLEVLDQTTGQWTEVRPAATYRLFVLSFSATGGDGYETLANVPTARRSDIGVLDADVLQTYIDRQAEREPARPAQGGCVALQHQVVRRVAEAAGVKGASRGGHHIRHGTWPQGVTSSGRRGSCDHSVIEPSYTATSSRPSRASWSAATVAAMPPPQ